MAVVTGMTAADQFQAALIKQSKALLGTALKAELLPIEFTGTGDFHWFYEDDGYFNFKTYTQINQRVGRSQVVPGLKLLDPFTAAYVRVLKSISFTLSQKDGKILTAAIGNVEVKRNALVHLWEQRTKKEITDQMIQEAGVEDKLAYIVKIIRTTWAATGATVTWMQLKTARNWDKLLPNQPPMGEVILPALGDYLNAMGDAAALEGLREEGRSVLKQLIDNTTAPSKETGGMRFVDPENPGAATDKFINRFNMDPTVVSNIYDSLKDDPEKPARAITIDMDVVKTASGQFELHVDGQAAGSFGSFLKVSIGTNNEYDLTKSSSTFDRVTLSMTYPGVTKVAFQPMPFEQALSAGWFLAQPIAEAYKNGNADVTGYKFVTAPPFDLSDGPNANFGMLSGLVISAFPTITMTYEHADYNFLKETFKSETTVGVKLFGFIPLGKATTRVFSSKVTQDSTTGKVTVKLSPPAQTTVVPSLSESAQIIGGMVLFPAKQ